MNSTSDTKPLNSLKSNPSELINQINETHRPIIFTQKGIAKAVLQDPESFEQTRNAISIFKIIGIGDEDIKNGRIVENEDVFQQLEQIVNKSTTSI